MKKRLQEDFRIMTPRSYLPIAIAGGFGVAVLIAIAVFILHNPPPGGPSQQELAADYAQGLKYERGDGVIVNYQTAMQFYRKAAEGGYPAAELSVGTLYMVGRGVAKDPKQASEWFRRAAEHGLPEAQVQFAGESLSGVATSDGKPDQVEAMKWLLIGADQVADPLMKQVAITQRAALADKLTPDERVEAERRAADWQKQHQPQ